MKPNTLISILLSACLSLSACNLPGSAAPDSSAVSTSAAVTVQAVLSTPTATQPPLASPTATSPACEDNATHTSWTRDDVTYDVNEVNKRLPPNDVFTMSWRLQNTGTCIWNDAYLMHFDDGTQVTDAEDFPIIPIGAQVPPGESVTVTIPMSAPELPGDYESSFSLQNGQGESVINFGVLTKVGSTSSASLASPGELRYTYDCSSGSVNISLRWLDRANNEDGYRVYRDGNLLATLGAGSTTYSDVAPASGNYNYTVEAYNGSGDSPASMKVNTDNCG